MSTCLWCSHAALMQEFISQIPRQATRRMLSSTAHARRPRQASRPARQARTGETAQGQTPGNRSSRPNVDRRNEFGDSRAPARTTPTGRSARQFTNRPPRTSMSALDGSSQATAQPRRARPPVFSSDGSQKERKSTMASSKSSLPEATSVFGPAADGALEALEVNVYSITQAPDRSQLKTAERFFTRQQPTMLFSYPMFRSLPQSHHPEITVLGRSNVGKSSLLNALFSRSGMALTSKKPGKTRLMNAYGVSPRPLSDPPQTGTKGEIMAESWRRMSNGLMLVDQPGYGTGSHENWGREIMKYIEHRKQLRRAFILIDSEHGLKSTDLAIITHLYRNGIPHTIVLSKIDKYIHPGPTVLADEKLSNALQKVQAQIAAIREQLRKEVWAGREAATDFLCVSAEKSMDGPGNRRRKFGIDELRWAMLCACGLQNEGAPRPLRMNEINIID